MLKFLHGYLLFFLFLLPSAWADGIGINVLRIIYPAGKKSVSVSLRNNTDSIWLMQSYITRVTLENRTDSILRCFLELKKFLQETA